MLLSKPSAVKSEDIKAAVKGVVKFASNNPNLQKQLFNEEFPLFVQINSFKIPTRAQGAVKQVYRIPLEHSPLPPDADVCVIVPDVKGVPNKEHERHVEHYEADFRAKGVEGIKKIMTFHEFRTEYDTFELKNRLVDLYDVFLVDGRISGKVVHKCGSIFYKKRKVPISVKLHVPKLKTHLEQALKKTFFQLNLKSDSSMVQIGHSKMKVKHLVENTQSVVEFIEKHFPGGIDNIRSLNVYAHRGSSVPIYFSLKNPNEIKVPKLVSKKPKAYKSYKGELTTQYNADVVVKPTGDVSVKRKKNKGLKQDVDEDDDITDADIIRENKKKDQVETDDGVEVRKTKKRKLSEAGEQKSTKNMVTLKKTDDGVKVIKKSKKIKLSEANENVQEETKLVKTKNKVTSIKKGKTIEKVGGPKKMTPIKKKR